MTSANRTITLNNELKVRNRYSVFIYPIFFSFVEKVEIAAGIISFFYGRLIIDWSKSHLLRGASSCFPQKKYLLWVLIKCKYYWANFWKSKIKVEINKKGLNFCSNYLIKWGFIYIFRILLTRLTREIKSRL